MKLSMLLLFIFMATNLIGQDDCKLCKTISKGQFNKMEHIVKTELLKYKYGTIIKSPSASYTNYDDSYDTIVAWLNSKSCVEQATWDKCQDKIQPYPNFSRLGFRLKSGDEFVFHIQQGHSNNLKNRLKFRERLYYLSMTEDKGFVKKQITLCKGH
ncbi:hypothetical protein [Brumimicrobium aurantiacum]|nr:hypothetical protein [Brumimicrobium aurantiacum]